MVFKERVDEANRIASQEIKAFSNTNAKYQDDDDDKRNSKTKKKMFNKNNKKPNKKVKMDF